jgi:hypothetical protein
MLDRTAVRYDIGQMDGEAAWRDLAGGCLLSTFEEGGRWVARSLPAPGISVRFGRISTPKMLEYSFIAVVVLSLVAFFTASAAIVRMQEAVAGIGGKAKPAVVLAERLSVTLADMDAQITDSSLGNGQSWSRYLADIDAAVAAAATANRTVRDDDPEAESLRTVQLRLRNYYQLVGGSSVTSPDIFVSNEQLAKTTTLWASRTMRQDIISQAQNAAEIATGKLGDAYAEFRLDTGLATALALAPVLLLVVVLIVAQNFITRRTRRLINIPLALATVISVGFIVWFAYAAETGRAAMLAAKETAFDDLQTLYRAKVTAYLMKADESMWLFELRKARFEQRRLRAFYAHGFSDAARQLIDTAHVAEFPAAIVEGESYADPLDRAALDQVQSALDAAAKLREAGQFDEAIRVAPQIPGILGGELQHFAAAGLDWKSAYEAVTYLIRYIEIDRRIRTTALDESRDKAVQLSIGGSEGGANWAFGRMDAALDRMIAQDDAEFETRFRGTMANLTTLPPILASGLIFAVLLSGWGLWQRYREYR